MATINVATELDIKRVIKFFALAEDPTKSYCFTDIQYGIGRVGGKSADKLKKAINLLVQLGVLGVEIKDHFYKLKSPKKMYFIRSRAMLPIWQKHISCGLWNDTEKKSKLEIIKLMEVAGESNPKMVTEELNTNVTIEYDGEDFDEEGIPITIKEDLEKDNAN